MELGVWHLKYAIDPFRCDVCNYCHPSTVELGATKILTYLSFSSLPPSLPRYLSPSLILIFRHGGGQRQKMTRYEKTKIHNNK